MEKSTGFFTFSMSCMQVRDCGTFSVFAGGFGCV